MSNSTRKFLTQWLLANTLSFGVTQGMLGYIFSLSIYLPATILMIICSVIPIIAFAQWLVLRSFFTGFTLWIPITIGGFTVGLLLNLVSQNDLIVALSLFALSIGCMQCLVIKQRFVEQIWWVLASTIGLYLGVGGISVASSAGDLGRDISFSIGGAIYAAVTGICIIYLERRTIAKKRN